MQLFYAWFPNITQNLNIGEMIFLWVIRIKKISFSAFFHPSPHHLGAVHRRDKSCSIHKHDAEIPPPTPDKRHRPSTCYTAVMLVKCVRSLPERRANEHSATLIFHALPHKLPY
jgi:hypothetical protein